MKTTALGKVCLGAYLERSWVQVLEDEKVGGSVVKATPWLGKKDRVRSPNVCMLKTTSGGPILEMR